VFAGLKVRFELRNVLAEGFVGSNRGRIRENEGIRNSKQNKRQSIRLTLYSNKSAMERGRRQGVQLARCSNCKLA